MTTDHIDTSAQPQLCCQEIESFVRTVRLVRPPSRAMRIGQVEVIKKTKGVA